MDVFFLEMLPPSLLLNLGSGGKGGEGKNKTTNVALLSVQQFGEPSPYRAWDSLMDFDLCYSVAPRIMSGNCVAIF